MSSGAAAGLGGVRAIVSHGRVRPATCLVFIVIAATAFAACGDDAAVDSNADTDAAGDVAIADTKFDSGPFDTLVRTDGETHDADPCPWLPYGDGLVGGGVGFAAFDPRLPGVAYVAHGSSLARSADDARTFAPLSNGAELASAPRALAFPPDDPKRVLAATSIGVLVSEDSGVTFAPLALGGLDVRALLVHPALPQRLFAGTAGAGILRSDDGGATFRAANVGVPRMIVDALAAPHDDPNVALAAGVLQNDTYGPGDSGVILRTDDGGATWATVATDVFWGWDLAFCPSDASRAIAAVRKSQLAGGGALASNDGGRTWARVPALADKDVLHVAYAAGNCSRVWVTAYRGGVYRLAGDPLLSADDGGAVLVGPLTDGMVLETQRFQGAVAAHPSDRDVVLAATHVGLFRSDDAGDHWRALDTGASLGLVDLAGDGDRLWLTTAGGGLWGRREGSPWRAYRDLPRDFTWLVAPLGDRLLVGSADDVWLADRDGAAFALAPGLFNATAAIALAGSDAAPELLVASQVAGLMRSRDPTVVWTSSNSGLAPFATSAGTFIDARGIVADRAGRLYLALRGQGVAVSDDLGATWTQPDNALAADPVIRLLLDAATDRLYAEVDGKGLFVSTDRAATWTSINDGLDTLSVADLVLDDLTGRLYVADGHGGILASDDGLAFAPLDTWCLPVEGWSLLAFVDLPTPGVPDETTRWLVAATRGNRVVRHRL